LSKKKRSQQPCAKLVETNKCNTFAMIYKLLKLVFALVGSNCKCWTCFFNYESCEESTM